MFIHWPFSPANSENLNIHRNFADKKWITERIRKRTRRVRRNSLVLLTSGIAHVKWLTLQATVRPTSEIRFFWWGGGVDLLRSGRASCNGFPQLLNVPGCSTYENNYDRFLSTKTLANQGRRFSFVFGAGAIARFQVGHKTNNKHIFLLVPFFFRL